MESVELTLRRRGRGRNRPARRLLAALEALRMQYLLFELGPLAIGTALAAEAAKNFDLGLATVVIISVVLIGQASEPWNEYFDWRSGADDYERETILSGGSGVVARGALTPRALVFVAVATGLIGIGLGVVACLVQPRLIPLYVAGTFLAIAYSMPPFRLRYRGLGELAMGLGKGTLVIWAAYLAQVASLSSEAIILGGGYAFVVASFMHVKCFGRWESDRGVGKKTLLGMVGLSRGVWAYALLFTIAYASLFVSIAVAGTGWFVVLTCALIPLIVALIRDLRTGSAFRDQKAFQGFMRRVLVATNGFPLLLSLGIVLNGG